jgi:N-acetylglucosaminyldiphosphoundecaprenol N-acetyl-beta-D-mannosaminyltransferase
MEPLPFRPLTSAEDEALIEKINNSGAGLVFICLGCPKQEYWMAQHQNKIKAVMLGVGAVFSVYAGMQKRAPLVVRDLGLEWLYRLIQEPYRLWDRYSQTIPPFIWLALKQLQGKIKSPSTTKLAQIFNSIIKNQHSESQTTDALFDKFEPSKIGEMLIRQNLVSETSLSMALEKQRIKNQKLGEILVHQEDISQAELEYYLRNQRIKLGELLIDHRITSQSQLNEWLKIQKSNPKKLGEIMVEEKILSHEQLNEFLIEQYCRQQGLWLMS